MAEKDDDFMEGDESAEAKEGGKGKPRFASALILQILKWVAIVLGCIVLFVTIAVLVNLAMTGGQKQNERTDTESPAYDTVVPVLGWYEGIPELRGVTNDDPKRTFVVQIKLGFPKEDLNFEPQLAERKIQVTDMLLTWFSKQKAADLINIDNRDAIRETLRAEINRMLEKPLKDVRFTAFQILDF